MKNSDLVFLKKLVKIKSTSDNQKACFIALELIKNRLEKLSIPVSIQKAGGALGLFAGDENKARFLILSHIDVVLGNEDQFMPRLLKDKLFGRGVIDMKGPLVAVMLAFERSWKESGQKLIFAVTTDEEIGGKHGMKLTTKKLNRKIDGAIVLDGCSGNKLVTTQKAPFHIEVVARGKSVHASRPWLGVNAAENLCRCLSEIVEILDKKNKNETSATITQVHSGEAINTIPAEARGVIDIRIKGSSELDQIEKIIDQMVQKYMCYWKKIDKAMWVSVTTDSEFIQKWISIFEETTRKNIRTAVESGASDARFLMNKLKIPILITNANGGGHHSKREWVSIKSLDRLTEMLVKFFREL